MSEEMKNIIALKQRAEKMLKNDYSRKIGDEEIYTIICEWEKNFDLYKKEKEQNSLIKDKLKELNIPMETLIGEFDRLEDLEDDTIQLKWRLKEEKEKNEQAVIRLEYYIINNMALAKDEDRLNNELKKVLNVLKGVKNE